MKIKSRRTFEIISILLLAFIIILFVFFIVNLGVKQFKAISGNAISSDEKPLTNSIDWIFITLISSIIIITFIEIMVRKRLLKIDWDFY